MPRGRSFPFAFGIHTRLTGRTSRGDRWMAATSCALACEVRATCPSTPAVKRPALRCVTCRTLTSVLDRERSISFCRLRTRLWSPARVAAKIRCRSRRTSSSAARQSTASQSKPASLGPFTTTLPGRVVASNLSLGSNGLASVLFADPPGPRQPPFEAGHPGPYPAGYTTRPPEERSCCAAFPSPFGMPALACWTILFPPRSSAPLTLGLPATAAGRTSTGLPRCPRVRPNRGGRLLDPGAMVSTRQERSVPAGIRHITAASPEPPPQQPSAGDPQSRGINEGSPYSPVPPEMAREPSGFPPGFAPRRYQRRTPGQGQALGHWPEITPPTSAKPPIDVTHSQRAPFVSQPRLAGCPARSERTGPGRSRPLSTRPRSSP